MGILEKYTIIRTLGTKTKRKFGENFLVENKVTLEKFVLKSIKKTKSNELACARLIDEASFSFDLVGLPKIIKIEENNDAIHLIKNYVKGETIDIYWSTIKTREQNSFIKQLVQKLTPIFQELANNNIVHCDIKPGNILIAKNETSFDVHLIDFGLAINQTNLQPRNLLFPLGYAAPELLLNHLDILTQATDIFGLGILIWRLQTGKIPLTHPNPSIFTNLQLTHPVPEHDNIRKDLFRIISKMTYKHSFKLPPNKMEIRDVKEVLLFAINKRYQSLEEVLNDLQKLSKKHWLLPDKISSIS